MPADAPQHSFTDVDWSRLPRPEDDGVTESVFYFDPSTWLMLGTELRGLGGEFLASYWFCDLRLNPPIPPETFTRAALQGG